MELGATLAYSRNFSPAGKFITAISGVNFGPKCNVLFKKCQKLRVFGFCFLFVMFSKTFKGLGNYPQWTPYIYNPPLPIISSELFLASVLERTSSDAHLKVSLIFCDVNTRFLIGKNY